MSKNLKRTKYNSGFTLIELMTVISIIAMLSSIVLANVVKAKEKANDANLISTIKQTQTALELYKNDNGKYPGEGVSLDNCGTFNILGYNQSNCNFYDISSGSNPLLQQLVPKYIQVEPHTSYWSNNVTNYFIGYYTLQKDDALAHQASQVSSIANQLAPIRMTCDRKENTNYILYFFSGARKFNFPIAEYEDINGNFYDVRIPVAHPNSTPSANSQLTYCVSM